MFQKTLENTKIRILYPKKYDEHTYHFTIPPPPPGRKHLRRCDQHSAVFEEVSHAADIHTGRPALEVGDLVIVDTLRVVHHEEAEVP